MRRLVLVFGLIAAGCVFPADEPTGIEFSWRFLEKNKVDGEDARRVRSCEGALIDGVRVGLRDNNDETRRGSFRFTCADGFQTASDFQTSASDAFLQLRSGDYDLKTFGMLEGVELEQFNDRTVEVLSRGLTVETFEFKRDPAAMRLELVGGDACAEMSLGLFYADAEATLPDVMRNEAGEVERTRYRKGLQSDRELQLDGQSFACDPANDGPHVVTGLDPGEYELDVDVDGDLCAVSVTIEGEDTAVTIDLANLPCDA